MPGHLAKHPATIAQADEAMAPPCGSRLMLDLRIFRELWVRFGALGPWPTGARHKREMQTLGRAGVRSSASSRPEWCHAADPKA